jgi:hypothetical protein
MKKVTKILLTVLASIAGAITLFLIVLTFAFGSNHHKLSGPASPKGAINVATLTTDQQGILDLLSIPNTQEVLIFDFDTGEAYSSVEFWVEIYQNGELVDQPAGLRSYYDFAERQEGRLAVIIAQNPHFYWILTVVSNGGRASHVSTSDISVESSNGRVYGPMDEAVIIEDGKEIVLYRSLFSADGSLRSYDTQTFQERPELLDEYLYAHIIKCKFSK